MNSSALNNACIDIWKKASVGMFIDKVTVISPSWLRVERAIIFISFSRMAIIYTGCGKKVTPKIFLQFSQQLL